LERIPRASLPAIPSALVLEKIPFFILSVIFCVVTVIAQKRAGAVASLTVVPFSDRIVNVFVSYARYLGKTFWPSDLAFPYPFASHWPVWLFVMSVALVSGLTLGVVWLARKCPYLVTGWFWFLGTLVPVIGLVQAGEQSLADRYTYVPLIGVFVALVWGSRTVLARMSLPRPAILVLAGAPLLACALVTRIQLRCWSDGEALFTHSLAVTKNNWLAYIGLGDALTKKGQLTNAIHCFDQAQSIFPEDPIAPLRLGESFSMLGDQDKARSFLERAAQLNPRSSEAWFNLGNVFAKRSDWDQAILNYRRALRFAPVQADVLNNLGLALAAKQQLSEAVTNFEAALKLAPDYTEAINNLATVLFMQGRFDQAVECYRKALDLAPENPQLYANLGDALVKAGKPSEAAQSYQAALRLNPADSRTRAKLQALNGEVPR
jgi:tetratricopeptide (TPR) repeat protein